MNRYRGVAALLIGCALIVSVFAAEGASASTGTTAVTCKPESLAAFAFKDSHCREKSLTHIGLYEHVPIGEKTTTNLNGNSSGEAIRLKTTVGGVGITFTSTSLSVSGGTVENKTGVPKKFGEPAEHLVHGEGIGIFNGATVNVPKCFVYRDTATGLMGEKERVESEELTGTTAEQGDAVKFTPRAGEVLARFWILDANKKTSAEGGECSIGSTYTLTGSVIGVPEGATTRFTHLETTGTNTLKLNGSKAGIEGRLTLEGADPKIVFDPYKPLSVTTVTT